LFLRLQPPLSAGGRAHPKRNGNCGTQSSRAFPALAGAAGTAAGSRRASPIRSGASPKRRGAAPSGELPTLTASSVKQRSGAGRRRRRPPPSPRLRRPLHSTRTSLCP
jgi:hypothetical protein